MHLVIYTSEYTGTASQFQQDCDHIKAAASVHNREHHITGVLLYCERRFLQIIEGPVDEIEQLMTRLEQDTRHVNIERILTTSIQERRFDQWSMDCIELSKPRQFTKENIISITKIYHMNFLPDAAQLADFYRKMLDILQINTEQRGKAAPLT